MSLDEDSTLTRMGWTVTKSVSTSAGVTVRTHQCTKDRRRLTYTITTGDGSTTVSLGTPVCEILQEDGSWLAMTWREWAGGMPDQDFPFPSM